MNNRSMLKRRSTILKMLSEDGKVRTKDLISKLEVSDETIRKDLIVMERQGILKREYGIAILISQNDEEAIELRNMEHVEAKNRIAREALKYIPKSPNTIIALDAGSTVWCLARLLSHKNGQNIVTTSVPTAELFNQDTNNVYLAGGLLRKKDKSLYGQWTIDCLNSIGTTVAVLGSSGIKNRDGLCAVTFDDAESKRAMVRNSEFSIALLDSSKFEKRSLVEAVKWEDIDYVITDEGIDSKERDKLSKRTKLILV